MGDDISSGAPEETEQGTHAGVGGDMTQGIRGLRVALQKKNTGKRRVGLNLPLFICAGDYVVLLLSALI